MFELGHAASGSLKARSRGRLHDRATVEATCGNMKDRAGWDLNVKLALISVSNSKHHGTRAKAPK